MKKLPHHKQPDGDLEIYLNRRSRAMLSGDTRFELPKSQQRLLSLTKRIDRRFVRRSAKAEILAEFAEFCEGQPVGREVRLS